ncbi:hypothetical protein QYM36_013261 [Artemia franciscana]|uniref:S1 motif domain-containing protein n=1 Tax=Artemia franciscana TaxID=6661 RepID=A0AA88HIC2_ARTSF|nr:hypothetical protein QYM36_013261 [Artemia franciscana]
MSLDFPRGGSEAIVAARKKNFGKRPKSGNLFKKSELHRKKKTKKLKIVAKDHYEEDYLEPSKKKKLKNKKVPEDLPQENASNLTHNLLSADMKILGKIMAISDLHLLVSLPGRIVGKVPITNVSTPYTEALKNITNEVEATRMRDQVIKDLGGMFEIGQSVVVNVVHPKADEKLSVELSLDPKDVNTNIPSSHVTERKILVGAIQSIEDHGYVVDLGIRNARAFLGKTDTPLEEDDSYGIGQVIEVGVKKAVHAGGITNANLTTMPDKLNKWRRLTLEEDSDFIIDAILPGTIVDAVIEQAIPEGLKLSFYSSEGYVHQDHFPGLFDTNEKYTSGDKVQATILYTLPIVKTIHLSLTESGETAETSETGEGGYKVGDILKKAVVVSSNSTGVFLRLGNRARGFVPTRHLHSQEHSNNKIQAAHPIGSKRKCRIIHWAQMDRTFICTMKEDLLKTPCITLEELSVGQVLTCKVKERLKHGVVVFIGISKHFQGYIPRIFWDDATHRKKESKLQPGAELQCRVLSVDPAKRRLHLTNKKSIVKSQQPILAEFEDFEEGVEQLGTVVAVKREGAVIGFYNDITGFLPNSQVLKDKIVEPREFFRLGQVVKTRVISLIPEENRMVLSMLPPGIESKLTPDASAETSEEINIARSAENSLERAAIYNCIIEHIDKKGIKITIDNVKGMIPIGHISDFERLNEKLVKTYEEGDVVEAVCLSKEKLVFSMKESQINLAKNGLYPKDLMSVEGMILPLVAVSFKQFGIFCEAIGLDKQILMHKKSLPVTAVSQGWPCVWNINKYATISARIGQPKNEGISAIPVSRPSIEYTRDSFENFMTVYERLYQCLTRQMEFKLGKRLEVQVVESRDNEVDLKSSDGSSYILLREPSIEKYYQEGSNIEVYTVWMSPESEKVFVTDKKAIGELLQTVDKAVDLDEDSKHPVVVVHKDENVTIACSLGSAGHRIVCLPQKWDINDYVFQSKEENLYKVGFVYDAVIQGNLDEFSLGLLQQQVQQKKLVTRMLWPKRFEEFSLRKSTKQRTSEVKFVNYGLDEIEPKRKLKVSESSDVTKFQRERTVSEKLLTKKQKTIPSDDGMSDEEVKATATDTGLDETEPKRKRKVSESPNVTQSQKRKDSEKLLLKKEKKVMIADDFTIETVEAPCINVGDFSWDVKTLPIETVSKEESDSDQESENERSSKKVSKKKADRLQAAKEEERQISEIERTLMNPDRLPQSTDDFDRLLISSPNSSIIWIKYMAYHLEQTEIEKARAVARRALKVINFREENEKLNVWMALLNLENMYGTPESMKEVFAEAVVSNDSLKVYQQTSLMLATSGKIEQAEEMYSTMMKKFKTDKTVWMSAFLFFMKSNQPEKAKNALDRSLKSLEKRHPEAPEVVIKTSEKNLLQCLWP